MGVSFEVATIWACAGLPMLFALGTITKDEAL